METRMETHVTNVRERLVAIGSSRLVTPELEMAATPLLHPAWPHGCQEASAT